MYMPTTTHILSDETGQLILAQLQAISQALDAGALSGTQIDTVLADQTPTGAGFLDGGGLKRFFDGLQVQIDALGESVSQIKAEGLWSATTSLADTGLSVTIPAGKTAIISASIVWYNSQPNEVALYTGGNVIAYNSVPSGLTFGSIFANVVVNYDTDMTVKVYGSSKSAASNMASIIAILIN